jgi:hypothetical protein
MDFRKMTALFCVSFVLVSGLVVHSTPGAQNREASKEVKSKLFKQVLAEFGELRECVEKEEGGARAAEEGTTVEEVDLNRDGVPEYHMQLSSPCDCGMVNCAIYVYRQNAGGYQLILDNASGLGLGIATTRTNGFVDLEIESRATAFTRLTTTYKFDGKQYRESGATILDVETGETKPAQRRVQFKPGTASTTVQGKVTRALSETYLVGARAGQTMTVRLTGPNKSLNFFVSSPKTTTLIADNTRNWTGTLPETGDYTIIVQADARASYTMTITIK